MENVRFDVIVLAGGTARRLGGIDKPALEVGGRTLLEHAVAAVGTACRVVVVGPPRPLSREVIWCREDPPGGGPMAALAAGLDAVAAEIVLVLAADLPWVAPAVPLLLASLAGGSVDTAVLGDACGRVNYLAAAWRRRALVAGMAAIGAPAGARMRELYDTVEVAVVPDTGGWGRDCDTWNDLDEARRRQENRP